VADEEENPIEAKIISATTSESQGLHSDSLLLSFTYEGAKMAKAFTSPFLNDENILLWRRVVMAVIWNQTVAENDPTLRDFELFKGDVLNTKVYIAFDGEMVHAVGNNPKNMFWPSEYGLAWAK